MFFQVVKKEVLIPLVFFNDANIPSLVAATPYFRSWSKPILWLLFAVQDEISWSAGVSNENTMLFQITVIRTVIINIVANVICHNSVETF